MRKSILKVPDLRKHGATQYWRQAKAAGQWIVGGTELICLGGEETSFKETLRADPKEGLSGLSL